MGYRPQSGAYGQPEIRPGTAVRSDNGWSGTVTEIIPPGRGYDGGVSVAWHGDGTTVVAHSMLVFENGEWIVRTTQPAPVERTTAMETPLRPADDDATQLAYAPRPEPQMADNMAAPAQHMPTNPAEEHHVNPYYGAPPLEVSSQTPVNEMMPADDPYRAHDVGARSEALVVDAAQHEVTVPIISEQVDAHPEWRAAGSVVVRMETEEVPQTLTQETERDELFVERIPVGRVLNEGEEVLPRQEGDVYVMPVVIEEAVITTRRVLAEEVRVTKRVVRTMQTVETILHQQRAVVDAGQLTDRVHHAGTEPASNTFEGSTDNKDPKM